MRPSLCQTCANMQEVRTARSCFLLCRLSASNADYRRYPSQPVERCDGYRREDETPNHLRIDYLADHPDSIQILAAWHHAEWKELLLGWTLEQAESDLRSHTGRRQVPTTFIALQGDWVIGSVSLLAADLDGWEHLTPWVASVYVQPECRGKGIGRQLVLRAVEEAKELGFTSLFLWTAGQVTFYERLGWQQFATSCPLGLVNVVVMRLALVSPGTPVALA
jgi:N-acetylglutamate synthase-like GNAT family acetyltransferase